MKKIDRHLRVALLGALAAGALGCSEPAPPRPETPPPAQPQPQAQAPIQAQAAPGTNPFAASELKREQRRLKGHVEERITAGGYTYLSVRLPDDSRLWVVTMGAGEPEGTEVDVNSMGERTNFYSRRLNRTFDRVLFAVVRPVI